MKQYYDYNEATRLLAAIQGIDLLGQQFSGQDILLLVHDGKLHPWVFVQSESIAAVLPDDSDNARCNIVDTASFTGFLSLSPDADVSFFVSLNPEPVHSFNALKGRWPFGKLKADFDQKIRFVILKGLSAQDLNSAGSSIAWPRYQVNRTDIHFPAADLDMLVASRTGGSGSTVDREAELARLRAEVDHWRNEAHRPRKSLDAPAILTAGYSTSNLLALQAAIHKFWINYDPSDSGTAPDKAAIIAWLRNEQGCSERTAEAIDLIIRHDSRKTGGKKR